MTAVNILVLVLYTGLNNFYLYELFWGRWSNWHVKCFFYIFTSAFLLYIIVCELFRYDNQSEYETNIICKFTLLCNFIIFALTQLNFLPKPIDYLYLLNGSVFAVSVIIIISGLRHGAFKR